MNTWALQYELVRLRADPENRNLTDANLRVLAESAALRKLSAAWGSLPQETKLAEMKALRELRAKHGSNCLVAHLAEAMREKGPPLAKLLGLSAAKLAALEAEAEVRAKNLELKALRQKRRSLSREIRRLKGSTPRRSRAARRGRRLRVVA